MVAITIVKGYNYCKTANKVLPFFFKVSALLVISKGSKRI